MAKYTVTFSQPATREIESLSALVVQRIYPKIEALENNPRPHGVKKIEGEDDLYRIRIGGLSSNLRDLG